MSRRFLLVLGTVIAASSSLARQPEPPPSGPGFLAKCSVVPAPPAEALQPYGKTGPYATGVRLFVKGRFREAARALKNAWRTVRADLATVFSASACEPRRIRAVLSRTLFCDPPLAVPGDDRFLPPPEVRQALAHSLCVTGQGREAADVLWEAAMAGDDGARGLAGVLLASSGHPDLCLAMLPEPPSAPLMMLSRAWCLLRAGRPSEARSIASRASGARGPSAGALRDLLRGAGVPCPEEP